MFSADLGVNQVVSYPPATDPPFQKVALLLHGDGTNGAQNNTFVDYSYPGGYAVSFDGTGDYLQLGSTSSSLLMSGTFTLECWVMIPNGTSQKSYSAIYSGDATNNVGLFSKFGASPDYFTFFAASPSTTLSSGVASNDGNWHHVAVVRNSSNTVTIYVDGIAKASVTKTGNFDFGNGTAARLGFATNNDVTTYFNGYVSNLRLTNTALYTSDFTPSNQPLTAVSGTQLLTCQSATIVDNSPNAFTITANGNAAAVSSKTITRTGNVAQGTFSPFSLAEGQWSNYFDGSGDYLSVASTFSFTGDFTVECFVSPTGTTSGFGNIFGNGNINNSIQVYRENSTKTVRVNKAFFGDLITGGTISLNTWNHVALTRSGSTLTLWLNGVSQGTSTTSVTTSWGVNEFWIGNQMTGYISNFRATNSVVYTANFTPPTSALTAITNTSLLTCQSNRFKDNSSNNFTITPSGDAKVTAFSPFAPSAAYSASTNGGSGYFDGSGDYLSIGSQAALGFGTGNWTIETWVYAPSTSSATSQRIWSFGDDRDGLEIISGNFQSYNGAVKTIGTANANTWVHVAGVRNSGTIYWYINGILATSYVDSTNSSARTLDIGTIGTFYSPKIQFYTGYISNLRIVKGTAVYTSNFTPPTAPLTAVTNTQLLLNCTNAGIIDNAGKNDIETVGNAQISTSVKKYGTGSMKFNGTTDWLVVDSNPDLYAFGTGDYTVELWIYYNTLTDYQIVIDARLTTVGMQLFSSSAGVMYFDLKNASNTQIFRINTPSGALTTGTWMHIAISRSSGTTRLFVNGVLKASAADTFSYTAIQGRPVIGAAYGGGTNFNGYIDDLRITKGQALYTSNFTPPTQAFPNV